MGLIEVPCIARRRLDLKVKEKSVEEIVGSMVVILCMSSF